MHQSPKNRTEITRRRRSLLAAACMATFLVPAASASADSPNCGCSGGCQGHHGPIYKALDTVAGGIEKLLFLGLKHRPFGNRPACDDGCDAMSMSDMMMYEDMNGATEMAPPVRLSPMPQPMPSDSVPSGSVPAPQIMDQPEHSFQPSPLRSSNPTMRGVPEPEPAFPNAQPLRNLQEDATGSGVLPNDGSLFDSLQDPFRDDSAQLNAPQMDRQRTTKTLPASYRTSSRRTIKSR